MYVLLIKPSGNSIFVPFAAPDLVAYNSIKGWFWDWFLKSSGAWTKFYYVQYLSMCGTKALFLIYMCFCWETRPHQVPKLLQGT